MTQAPADDKDTAVQLNQSTAVILDRSTATTLDTSLLPPAFGHGTMVAGIIHLVAPTAQIMPLKAFRDDGSANLIDIFTTRKSSATDPCPAECSAGGAVIPAFSA